MTIEWVPLAKLRPNPKNPNKHTAEQVDRLVELIKHYGWRHPIIVSNQTGFVVVGHGRLAAAKKMGLKEVPVHYQDFTPEDEYGFMVADNGIARWAELDMAAINAEMPELGPEFDLELLGLRDFKLDPSELPVEVIDEVDDATEKSKKKISCPHCGNVFTH